MMQRIHTRLARSIAQFNALKPRRYLSDVPPSAKPTTPAPVKSGGSSFLQRLSSFLVGAGVGFGAAYYIIYEELKESNAVLENYIKSLKQQ